MQLKQVMLGKSGLVANMPEGGIIIINSTVSLQLIEELHTLSNQSGIDLVDAPLTGGPEGAAEKRLVYFAGGNPAAVDAVIPLLQVSAAKIIQVGESGNGIRAKLTHQLILGGNLMAASDGWLLGRRLGLSDKIIKSVVTHGAAKSRVAEQFGERELSAHGRSMINKDLQLCAALAEALGIEIGCDRLREGAQSINSP